MAARRDDEFEPALPSLRKGPKGVWDDEDVEDEDVKESWEDEDPKQPKSSWDDEDADDDDVKESWEDDEEPKQMKMIRLKQRRRGVTPSHSL